MLARVVLVAVALTLCVNVAVAQEVRIGEFRTRAHELQGEVFAIDQRTFEVRNLIYDGLGPAAFFWVGTGSDPSTEGFAANVVGKCGRMVLPEYRGDTVRVELPSGTTINDIGHLSVWCETAVQNFGEVVIPDAIKASIPEPTTPASCSAKGTFPVQDGWNCESLHTGYQVRWKVDRGNNIDFELVGKVNPGYWMGFGVSGDQTVTNMDNSDVVIATEIGNDVSAVDYFLNGRSQCAGGRGVCPDTTSTTRGGNDVSKVTGERKQDTLQVRYTRPAAASDAADLAFNLTPGQKTVLVWATGPFNSEAGIPQIHRGEMSIPPRGTTVAFDFAREPANNCPSPIIAMEVVNTVLKPWTDRQSFSGVTDFTARIGPNGGNQGVPAITQASSWGIAWYLSPTGTTGQETLIPAIAVERGVTYTFRVFGGNEPSNTGEFHPMYITSDQDGGFAIKSPQGRRSETIYAGIENITRDQNEDITDFNFTAVGPLCEFKSKPGTNPNNFSTFKDYAATLDKSCINRTPTGQAGVLRWTVPMNLNASEVYYQCATHRDLGFKLVLFDQGQVNESVLNEQSLVKAEEPQAAQDSPGQENQSCNTQFNGTSVSFDGCASTSGDNIRVLWSVDGSNIDTMFIAKSRGWAGMAWGTSSMVPADAVAAYVNNGEVTVSDYSLTGKTAEGVTQSNKQGIRNAAGELAGDELRMRFTRPLSGADIATLPTTGDVNLIWAIGDAPTNPPLLTYHGPTNWGKLRVDLSRTGVRGASSGSDRDRVLIAHAFLMGIAWIILAPVAIITMRYFKRWNPAAFQVHRALNMGAVLACVAAFIMGVVRGSHTNRLHLAFGIVVTIFALWQAVNGALRPGHGASTRKVWFIAHAWSGRIALLLAFANVFIGIKIFEAGATWNIVAGVLIGVFTAIFVILALMLGTFPIVDEHREQLVPDDKEQA